jgi:hypothetical protein
MLYTRKTFTLPASRTNVGQRTWDYATLTKDAFLEKYGADAHEYAEKPAAKE